MADNYDFQINNLKFRMAERRDLPYVRSTAPFRKEQFDTSATVGDQSLTGWWTRGQLSFHKGEGLKYYEVLESDSVLNRFWTSEHIEVFKTPGEARLDRGVFTILASPGAITSCCTFNGSNARLAFTKGSDDTLWTSTGGAAAAQVTLNGAGADADFVTGDQNYLYVAISRTGPVYEIQRYSPGSTPSYADTIYTSSAPCQVWALKGRLWILTSDDLYAVSVNPATKPTALSSPVCTFDHGIVAATDGGEAMFFGGGNRVYSITVSNDGTVPTLTAPTVALELPNGETVQAMRAYMGVLVLATSKGVRFAAISGAQLTIGPIVVEFYDSNCFSIGVRGSRVYAGGKLEQGGTEDIFEFDLTEPVFADSLIYPYRLAWSGTSVGCGAIESWFDDMVFMDAGAVQHTYFHGGSLYSTGTLRTAWHRLGTLDNKHFSTVTIRAEGEGGTIQVHQIESDETETSLGTLNVATDKVATYALTMGAGERVAFKFTLSRSGSDGSAGPTLLGYQVRALPVPERQRILRVPLVIADFVTLKHGTKVGTQGKGYSDLLALEALEGTAIVTFTDHRTGETGTAYIDQVEFQDNQPATHNDNGFGGFAYVTLRVLE